MNEFITFLMFFVAWLLFVSCLFGGGTPILVIRNIKEFLFPVTINDTFAADIKNKADQRRDMLIEKEFQKYIKKIPAMLLRAAENGKTECVISIKSDYDILSNVCDHVIIWARSQGFQESKVISSSRIIIRF